MARRRRHYDLNRMDIRIVLGRDGASGGVQVLKQRARLDGGNGALGGAAGSVRREFAGAGPAGALGGGVEICDAGLGRSGGLRGMVVVRDEHGPGG